MSGDIPYFAYLVYGIIGFAVIRILFHILVVIPREHAKDEAICETCFGKTRNDNVTAQLEWCHCPTREEEVDDHGGKD